MSTRLRRKRADFSNCDIRSTNFTGANLRKGDFIARGDYAIMPPLLADEELKEGEIVAVEVKEVGVTLKRLYNNRGLIVLKAFNSSYPPIETTKRKSDNKRNSGGSLARN